MSPSSNSNVIEKGSQQSGPFLYAQPTEPIARNAWIEIDRTRFLANAASVKKYIGQQVHIAAILKSNAYGHGLEQISQLCQESPHITYLTVFLLSDAVRLRSNGITKPILVLGGYDLPLQEAIKHDITITVHSQEVLDEVVAKSQELEKETFVHLKVETGLMRLGFTAQEIGRAVEALQLSPYITVTGMFSHFAQSDALDNQFTQQQIDQFAHAVTQLKLHHCAAPYLHLANTAATLRFPQVHWTMIRCGGLLYGSYKKEQFYQDARAHVPGFSLRQVMSVKSRIIAIKQAAAGTSIGYACSFVAKKPMRLATVSIGYYDGFDRRLSNKGHMLVHDTLCPVIGRVGMNMTTLDVSAVPQAACGDTVTVIGDHAGIRLTEVAHKLETIDYDMMIKLNAALPRIIV